MTTHVVTPSVTAIAAVLRRHIFGSQVLNFDDEAWIKCSCDHRIDVNVFDSKAQVGPAHDLFILHVAEAVASDINVRRVEARHMRIWVDFNDVDSEGRTTTLSQFGPSDLEEWTWVEAFDGDGLTRPAFVTRIAEDGVVHLQLAWNCNCGCTGERKEVERP